MHQFNTLSLSAGDKLVAALRDRLTESGFDFPETYQMQVGVQITGDPVTGYPIRRIAMRVIIKEPAEVTLAPPGKNFRLVK